MRALADVAGLVLLLNRNYLGAHAPPAITDLQERQFHIPTELRLTESFPQNEHVYFACCDISIFFICFRSEAPYLVPYFPTIPTFFVCLALH